MKYIFVSIAENMSQGGIKLLKTMGILVAAAVLLYLVLLLVRKFGGQLERKSYDKYVEKCKESGIDPISYEEYYERRAKGDKVLWKRENAQQTPSIVDKSTQVDPLVGQETVDENKPIEPNHIHGVESETEGEGQNDEKHVDIANKEIAELENLQTQDCNEPAEQNSTSEHNEMEE